MPASEPHPPQPLPAARKRSRGPATVACAAVALLAALPTAANAQTSGDCIPLRGSKACAAFQAASVSRNNALIQT